MVDCQRPFLTYGITWKALVGGLVVLPKEIASTRPDAAIWFVSNF
jgi:hypothetical protein